MRLCTEFIAKFEAKMNQLRFVQILCTVGKTCSGVLRRTRRVSPCVSMPVVELAEEIREDQR